MTRAPLAPILFKTKEGLSPQAPESKHLKKTNENSFSWARLSKQGLSLTAIFEVPRLFEQKKSNSRLLYKPTAVASDYIIRYDLLHDHYYTHFI